jgi:flagellar biogenesis protein FliO
MIIFVWGTGFGFLLGALTMVLRYKWLVRRQQKAENRYWDQVAKVMRRQWEEFLVSVVSGGRSVS